MQGRLIRDTGGSKKTEQETLNLRGGKDMGAIRVTAHLVVSLLVMGVAIIVALDGDYYRAWWVAIVGYFVTLVAGVVVGLYWAERMIDRAFEEEKEREDKMIRQARGRD